jgi:hypothetical protein
MFGYIRPLKDELKVREFEQFKACYCALCHTLKTQYGTFSRFILNYDFTFLAMLLWDEGEAPSYQCARCIACPVAKKTYCAPSRTLQISAGYSIILAWWKLRDSIADESFFKSLRDRALSILLRRAYSKASKTYSAFEKTVRSSLDDLNKLEKSGSDSLDACADKFALITGALASQAAGDEKLRPLEQLLYHTGRFIYIIDACDDLEEDIKNGSFNPVAKRFNIETGQLQGEDKESLRTTLMHSCKLIGTAYELLPQNAWSSIIRNILYLGMANACERVLSGTWNSKNVSRMNKGNDKRYE